MGTQSYTFPGLRRRVFLLVCVVTLCLSRHRADAQSTTLLRQPAGLTFDAQGALYFSQLAGQQIWKMSAGGSLSVVAGSGLQGFSGDSGPAAAASLDSPGPVVVDADGNVFFGDLGNRRIRRVDAATATITTVAGTGVAGAGPDGVLATASALDSPAALALDGQGNLFFADSQRYVVRRIDRTTGLMSTVAGDGRQGFRGDGGSALAASFDTPLGLAIDAAGDLFISDTHNHRIRRVDAVSGIVTTVLAMVDAKSMLGGLSLDSTGSLLLADFAKHTVLRVDPATGQQTLLAGSGVEGSLGDGGGAVLALLDRPHAVVASPGGLVTFADTDNGRIRQIDAAGIIHTLVGPGAITAQGLTLSGASTDVYGTGFVTVTASGGAVTGTALLSEGTAVVGTGTLTGNTATFSTSGLAAGVHTLVASFGAVQSNALRLTLTPAPVVATVNSVALLYGQAVPALTGTLSGVLARDASQVSLSLSSTAGVLSAAGSYPITAVLTGAAAANYVMSANVAAVTIARAPSSTGLTAGLAVHVAPSTAGTPSGSVALLDGGAVVATAPLSATGDAQFSAVGLSVGSHTLSASYAGDGNFLGSLSAPQIVTIGPAVAADFSLATTSASSVTVIGGSAATFNFLVTPTGSIPSQIVLSASGLPPGATATFAPAYLPPGSSAAPFVMTVQTVKTVGAVTGTGAILIACLVLPLICFGRKRSARAIAATMLIWLAGCGDRVNPAAESGATARTYNITVNATATGTSGTTLLHSAVVTLTIQ